MDAVRNRLGAALAAGVAGDDGDAKRQRIHASPGPRWFAEDAAIRRVHGDASMFVGGIRTLLLQTLHPLAMAGVAEHSHYRSDPFGRLQRTGEFLATTTFGTAADAERAVARVRGVHRRVVGTSPAGRPYAASDPHLLEWVHITEVDSFLRAHQRHGSRPLDATGCDSYVQQVGQVAERLGVVDPPQSVAEVDERLTAFRPELEGTAQARAAARFVMFQPPVPVAARPGYGVLAAAAVAMLPWWARWPLRLPYLPLSEATVVRAGGQAVTSALRWAMTSPTTP
ncbi:MAG: DUF2236 domain-containing protein [Nocardioidaceae bacterium]|nr:DUF2236 domain-containing protein [Nocardioidaceae bacterium]